jgi:hypothetical protein
MEEEGTEKGGIVRLAKTEKCAGGSAHGNRTGGACGLDPGRLTDFNKGKVGGARG